MTERFVIRRADLDGVAVDVTWSQGVVERLDPAGRAPLPSRATEIDADGGGIIPGLHDHHLHLMALAATRQSVPVGPPDVVTRDQFTAALSSAVQRAEGGWVRAVGYHDSVAGPLDAELLDALIPAAGSTPIRVQHRSGQLWMLNRRACDLVGLGSVHRPGIDRDPSGRPTGRVFGADDLLRGADRSVCLDMAAVGRELAAYGVSGVTDMTPMARTDDVEALASAIDIPGFPVRVTITGAVTLDPKAVPHLARGPVKFLPPDHDLPPIEDLAAGIAAAHAMGRTVAIHCVSRVGLIVALTAWRLAGAVSGDRIEHGAVMPAEVLDDVARLGLMVVTQPNFVAERGDRYLAEVEPDDLACLWPAASLREAGVDVVAGTDAPFGHPDPWRAIAAATTRRTLDGAVLGPRERVSAETALGWWHGTALEPRARRRVVAGSPTDLCLLDRPIDAVLDDPHSRAVRATLGVAGLTFAT